MEELIKRNAKLINGAYIIFWLIPLLAIISCELGGWEIGCYTDSVRATYWGETVTILLTIVCIPLALKSFAWALTHHIDRSSLPKAIKLYVNWSLFRLALLWMPVLAGTGIYYAMLSTTGLLCAAIALLSSLFCLPGEHRLRRDLCIDKDTSKESL